MSDLNLCLFIGRLGQDPETKHTAGGNAVTNFSIACSDKWKDRQSGEQQERTEWIRCVAFSKPAEIIGEHVRKGDQIHVRGRMQTRKWADQSGQDRWTTEVVVNDFQFIGGKRQDSAPSTGGSGMPSGGPEDDIPFAPLKGREWMA